jgi:Zn-dependent peptidase ImmA (M78 family)
MKRRRELATQALRGALETRYRAGVSKSDPICAYDLAEKLGVEVKFCSCKSLGGMYSKGSKTILLPARPHRPPGRQAFTCGHELAHWYFCHGTRVDELNDIGGDCDDPEEQLADTYAGYLLMPRWAVNLAFSDRGWQPGDCSPLQVYTVASQLGVGYETLIHHLRWSLNLVSAAQAKQLLRTTPKNLRSELLGGETSGHLVIADDAWNNAVAVDLQVDDLAVVPKGIAVEGMSVAMIAECDLGAVICGRLPGISRAEKSDGSWAVFVRVSRKNFEGRSIYRHMEDPDVDETTGRVGPGDEPLIRLGTSLF